MPVDTILETSRLRLRKFTLDDAAFARELVNDAAWLKYIGDRGVRTLDDAKTYIGKTFTHYERNGFGAYVVELKATGEAMGNCGLFKRDGLPDVDIGFAFLERFRGHGYAHEAAAATLALARERFGFKRIVAYTVPYNTSSIQLLEKLGLKFEAMIRLPGDDEDLSRMAVDF